MTVSFFFFNDTATTEIYTLSLHDALPICVSRNLRPGRSPRTHGITIVAAIRVGGDRKSTRLNSSHVRISYAVFCLKKKNHLLELLPGSEHIDFTVPRNVAPAVSRADGRSI